MSGDVDSDDACFDQLLQTSCPAVRAEEFAMSARAALPVVARLCNRCGAMASVNVFGVCGWGYWRREFQDGRCRFHYAARGHVYR